MHIYIKIYKKLTYIIRNIIYLIVSIYLKRNIKVCKRKALPDKRILIMVPHADDEWIGCSQLLKHKKYDVTLCYMNMLGGDTEKVLRERYLELNRISKQNGLSLISIDGNRKDKIKKLKEYIQEKSYYYIGVPSYYDWHEEHFDVMNILRIALDELGLSNIEILMYQVSVPMCEDMITNCIEMTKYDQENKWDTFREIYKTQEYIPVERFKYNEYINGGIANYYAAEVYSCMSYNKWIHHLDKVLLDKELRIDIKNNFTKLSKIRGIIKKFDNKQNFSGDYI